MVYLGKRGVPARRYRMNGSEVNGSAGLFHVFTSPSSAARGIAERPGWLVPLVIVLLVSFIFGFFTYKYQVEQQREMLERIQSERGVEIDIEARLADTPARRAIGGVQTAVFLGIFIILIPALVLNGVARVAGANVGFKRMFAWMAAVGLITSLGMLIKMPIVFAKGSIDVRTSLAMLAPSVDIRTPLGVFLNSFDIFSIWALVAAVIGFAVLTGFNNRKSAVIVGGLWLLYVLILVGVTALSSSLTGMG
jgi:hypothetical protein